MRLRDKLDRIRKQYPKGPTPYGQIYSGKLEPKRRFKRVTLYTLFVSDEGTHLLRPHVFQSERVRTSQGWAQWFTDHLTDIHIKAVLPGIGIRTSKSWAVKQILGWAAYAKHGTRNSRVVKQRNKAKPQRVKNGQADIRRRQRNRRRKAQ